MKSSAEIRSLKIISINEGKQISTVKDIVINSANGSLAFFIIEQPSDYFGARLISFEDIFGIGDYALIINDSEAIQDVAHNPLAIELLQKDVKIIGSQVLTTKGCLIGQVTEFSIDEKTGKITVCQLSNDEGSVNQFKCDNVITYGKDIILIEENPSAANTPLGRNTTEVPAGPFRDKELLKKRIEEFGKNDNLLKGAEYSEIIEYPNDFNVFEQRQLQFLVGKTLEKDIRLENGGLLRAGEQISKESLSAVKSRQALMQLTAHVVK